MKIALQNNSRRKGDSDVGSPGSNGPKHPRTVRRIALGCVEIGYDTPREKVRYQSIPDT